MPLAGQCLRHLNEIMSSCIICRIIICLKYSDLKHYISQFEIHSFWWIIVIALTNRETFSHLFTHYYVCMYTPRSVCNILTNIKYFNKNVSRRIIWSVLFNAAFVNEFNLKLFVPFWVRQTILALSIACFSSN